MKGEGIEGRNIRQDRRNAKYAAGVALTAGDGVVVFDFGDGGERNFYDLTVSTFDFDTGGRQSLSGFHALDRPPHSPPIGRDDFYVVFAVKGL
jgi:hypothetical protein